MNINSLNHIHFFRLKISTALRIMDKQTLTSWSVSDYWLINQLRQKKTYFHYIYIDLPNGVRSLAYKCVLPNLLWHWLPYFWLFRQQQVQQHRHLSRAHLLVSSNKGLFSDNWTRMATEQVQDGHLGEWGWSELKKMRFRPEIWC